VSRALLLTLLLLLLSLLFRTGFPHVFDVDVKVSGGG
jgi:hypothetical protein